MKQTIIKKFKNLFKKIDICTEQQRPQGLKILNDFTHTYQLKKLVATLNEIHL